MGPVERILIWIVALAALGIGIFDWHKGRELTKWAKNDLRPWEVHVNACHAHGNCGPTDHIPPPPDPPKW